MDKYVFPSKITGQVNAPASKSFMQRAIALAVLSNHETMIENPSRCNDALAGLNIAASFGFKVFDDGEYISFVPGEKKFPDKIFCGESGLAIRLFAPIAALHNKPVELIAEGSLIKRPADFMDQTFKQLGVRVKTEQGFPPVMVQGPLKGGKAMVDGGLSSQFLSGLLIALPKAADKTILTVNNLKSLPYVDMTLKAIEAFGGKIVNHDYQSFEIEGNQDYLADKYTIEGDWSGAAGLLVAGAIAGKVQVNRLETLSNQADFALLKALEAAGAKVALKHNMVEVHAPNVLSAFEFDALHCPDLFPVLTALAANCKGTSKISGVHRLTHKESDRGQVLKKEFNKLGVPVEFENDDMLIEGGNIQEGEVYAHNDHRIAMALTLAALNARGPVKIVGAECVNKTYPEFFKDMSSLGARVE